MASHYLPSRQTCNSVILSPLLARRRQLVAERDLQPRQSQLACIAWLTSAWSLSVCAWVCLLCRCWNTVRPGHHYCTALPRWVQHAYKKTVPGSLVLFAVWPASPLQPPTALLSRPAIFLLLTISFWLLVLPPPVPSYIFPLHLLSSCLVFLSLLLFSVSLHDLLVLLLSYALLLHRLAHFATNRHLCISQLCLSFLFFCRFVLSSLTV